MFKLEINIMTGPDADVTLIGSLLWFCTGNLKDEDKEEGLLSVYLFASFGCGTSALCFRFKA